ncbi:phosphoglycerol transferase MdoB-like AlkP superfamily enzyme [Paenibacillus eucommiae]|uniref:Phosphoglycerol transferase MdoB-like AlkP superfamily enzyme n=1 Tax=Paenibacillus eucommiae TaxID=1355755 RepID=A0ABS4J6G9_9BACL|nr:phosphoglycerol transferase MdoB-like AlkP superfamily enzyme [Paenibacillus eucommiae]
MNLIRNVSWVMIFLISYWAGLFAYERTLEVVWGETLGGDKTAVVFWSLLAFVVVLVPLYLLICYMIKTKISRTATRMLCYPFLCGLTFILPTAFIMASFGGGSLFSAEARLFYSFFIASGIVFGTGYGLISTVLTSPKSSSI